MMEKTPYRCGFVALMGPTNSGKSTLLNRILGEKVSIVSSKAQTTLHAIRGILTDKKSQVIFVDLPGRTRAKQTLTTILNRSAEKQARECDVLVWVFDCSSRKLLDLIENSARTIKGLKPQTHTVLILNKIDKISKLALLPIIQKCHETNLFHEMIPVSAKTGDGIERLTDVLYGLVPEGPQLYPKAQKTDRSQDFRISEIIREKIYQTTGEEIPYSAWIEVEHWEQGGRVPNIHARIHVDSTSKKGIIIGKRGQKLKEIGIRARRDVESLLGSQVCLKLFVDCQANWKKDQRHLNHYLEMPV